MFTQCPNCETTFQVTADQLKAANGDVRCGQCLTVFSALDNLSELIEADHEPHDDDPHQRFSAGVALADQLLAQRDGGRCRPAW